MLIGVATGLNDNNQAVPAVTASIMAMQPAHSDALQQGTWWFCAGVAVFVRDLPEASSSSTLLPGYGFLPRWSESVQSNGLVFRAGCNPCPHLNNFHHRWFRRSDAYQQFIILYCKRVRLQIAVGFSCGIALRSMIGKTPPAYCNAFNALPILVSTVLLIYVTDCLNFLVKFSLQNSWKLKQYEIAPAVHFIALQSRSSSSFAWG